MILVIDNYDSFTYNLVQYIGEAAENIAVYRNDEITVDEIQELDPDGIVVSPGPGMPRDAGISIDVFAETKHPALGVCLGHQAFCAAEGAAVGHAPDVVHGRSSKISHDGQGLFNGMPDLFEAGRYHSLAVERAELPKTLVETARTDDERKVVMGVRHIDEPQFGVQFHPESILTDAGKQLIANFCQEVAQTDPPERPAISQSVSGASDR